MTIYTLLDPAYTSKYSLCFRHPHVLNKQCFTALQTLKMILEVPSNLGFSERSLQKPFCCHHQDFSRTWQEYEVPRGLAVYSIRVSRKEFQSQTSHYIELSQLTSLWNKNEIPEKFLQENRS